MIIWESTFEIYGPSENQQVSAIVQFGLDFPLGGRIRFAVHELLFDKTLGELEDEKRFWEEWDLMKIDEPGESAFFSVEAIRHSKDGETWRNSGNSWMAGEFRVSLEDGPFFRVVELDEAANRISVHVKKNDAFVGQEKSVD